MRVNSHFARSLRLRRLYHHSAAGLAGGAVGLAMGRNIFASADPGRLAGKIARMVHQFPGGHLDDLIGGQQDDRRQAVLA